VLDAHDASFVSVTQQFNTTTSMGRLTLNMLLSFAQFEREIAGERIRDKIAASKKKGMWMGGNVPLGYDVKDRKLIVNEAEAESVRLIFRRYAELGSVALLKAELDRLGIVSKRREGAMGQLSGGKRFSRGALYLMLQNRLYRGEVGHKGQIYPGQHEAIIDPELWQMVQEKLAANRHERSLAVGAEQPSLLAGFIVDSDGNRMTPAHATKRGRRYRYYVSASLLASDRPRAHGGMRVPAGDIEGLLRDRLRACFSSRADVGDALAPLDLDAHSIDAALRNASALSECWLTAPTIKIRSLVRDIVDRVIVGADRIGVRLSRSKIAAALQARVQGKAIQAGKGWSPQVQGTFLRRVPMQPQSARARAAVFGERPISSGTLGLPTRDRDFYLQNKRNPARCQRMTVPGLAITKAFRMPGASR
jgi:hypothetical protein